MVLGGAALVLLLAVTASARAAQVPSPWTWTDYGPALNDVSCVTPTACVAVGQSGAVLRSPGVGGQPLAWSFVALRPQDPPQPRPDPQELRAVWCSPQSCLAVSNVPTRRPARSWVYRSTDGGATWTAIQQLPDTPNLSTASANDITCEPNPASAARRVCYAVGVDGGAWRSADDGRTWTHLDLPPPSAGRQTYRTIRCPSAGLCLAVGGDEATDATAALIRRATITPIKVPAQAKAMLALGCDTATRCTVSTGNQYATIDLPDGAWSPQRFLRPSKPAGTVVTSLDCPGADRCIGLAPAVGLAVRTDTLARAGDHNWQRRPLGSLDLAAVDCVGQACVAVGRHASWLSSDDGGGDWDVVNEVPKLDTVSCGGPLGPSCVAGGEKDLTVSRSRGELWSGPLRGYAGLNVKALNCTGPSTCLVLAKTLTLFTTDLAAFAARHPTITDPKGTDALTCVTDVLCVGLNEGVTYTTLDGAVTDWSQSGFPERGGSISCLPGQTAPVTCLALTRDFIVRGQMTPTGGAPLWRWTGTDADPDEILESIACDPTGRQCAAAGANGLVMTTTTDVMHWTSHTLPEGKPPGARPDFKTVTCPAAGVCLVGGGNGVTATIVSTTDNFATYSVDTITGILGAEVAFHGFGCESVTRCVGVGSTAAVGTRPG